MSLIGRSVKVVQFVGAFVVISLCLYTLCVCSEPASQTKSKEGALTIIDSEDVEGDEDGVVTVEENGSESWSDSEELFQPTKDWQPVKKGQKIPSGLHVRMSMKDGQREAKLMDDTQKSEMNRWDAGENIGIINTKKKRFSREQLQSMLKNFKYKDLEDVPLEQSTTGEENKVKNKFRSYDQLKKEMQDIKMSVKTEAEIVTDIFNKLKNPQVKSQDLETLLADLEYYLHQIDNAQLFCDMGGMKVMLKHMNSSEADIRSASILALGGALASNAKVQVNAIENGMMQPLLNVLSLDPVPEVRKKALFALSALLRQFPFAQKKFLDHGGLSSLSELFIKSKNERVQVKIITLLTDLILEYDSNINHSNSEDKVQKERSLQYSSIKLRKSMSSTGWCALLTSLLQAPSNHDITEKVLLAMAALVEECKEEFSPARAHLQALMSKYHALAEDDKEDGPDGFYASIHSTLKGLVSKLYRIDL